jgi:hypothetical protein
LQRLQSIPAKVTAREACLRADLERPRLPNNRHKAASRGNVVIRSRRLQGFSAFLADRGRNQKHFRGIANVLARRLQFIAIVETKRPLPKTAAHWIMALGD